MGKSWRNCYASVALIDEINKRWPNRDRASDGTIGDAAHATRTSDHNPWLELNGEGIVRARDVDKDGVDAAGLVEYLRLIGSERDNRLYPGGYLIFNRRITAPDFSCWKAYNGSNPHDKHFHVSFSTVAAGFDSTRPWGIWPAPGNDTTPGEGFLMALTDKEQQEILDGIRRLKPGMILPSRSPNARVKQDDAFGMAMNAQAEAADARVAIENLARQLTTGPVAGPATLSDTDVQRIAAAVLDELSRRAAA